MNELIFDEKHFATGAKGINLPAHANATEGIYPS
jgi:hypothetical protein